MKALFRIMWGAALAISVGVQPKAVVGTFGGMGGGKTTNAQALISCYGPERGTKLSIVLEGTKAASLDAFTDAGNCHVSFVDDTRRKGDAAKTEDAAMKVIVDGIVRVSHAACAQRLQKENDDMKGGWILPRHREDANRLALISGESIGVLGPEPSTTSRMMGFTIKKNE